MALTIAQLATLKADILADPVLNAQPNTPDGADAIAQVYNAKAIPTFTVWKTLVSISEAGRKFNGVELGGLTTANHTRLQTIAAFLVEGVNPSLPDNRAFFDDVFSGAGGALTRAALLALWKRPALRLEKLFATGVGSDASPATMIVEGTTNYEEVLQARNS